VGATVRLPTGPESVRGTAPVTAAELFNHQPAIVMKKLSTLLERRNDFLRQARLANLAFAYDTFRDFARRVERAGLRGPVTLSQPDANAERYWAVLTPHAASQAVVDEHFADEDIMDLANMIAFVTGNGEEDVSFNIERIDETFIARIRTELERNGVDIDAPPPRRSPRRAAS
jgi:hypothetical protein